MFFSFHASTAQTLAFKDHIIGALSTGASACVVELGDSTVAIQDVSDRREIKRRRPSRTLFRGGTFRTFPLSTLERCALEHLKSCAASLMPRLYRVAQLAQKRVHRGNETRAKLSLNHFWADNLLNVAGRQPR